MILTLRQVSISNVFLDVINLKNVFILFISNKNKFVIVIVFFVIPYKIIILL